MVDLIVDSEPGNAAIRQKIYYDRDTAPCHFKNGDWVIYWHKLTTMQTLSNGWNCRYIVIEKVSVIDYRIQLNLTKWYKLTS